MDKREYIVDGMRYSGEELMAFSRFKTENGLEWERGLYAFILLWLSGVNEIAMHTSGSTGKPRDIFFSRSSVCESAKATIRFFGLKAGDALLLCLPIKYVAARLMVVRALEGGMDLVILPPSGNPLAELHKPVQFAALVPLQVIAALADSPARFALVDQLIVGGSPVSSDLSDKLQPITTRFWETYGMTETLTHVAVRLINGVDKSTCFVALPGVVFSVDDRGCLVIDVPRIAPSPVVTNDVVRLIDASRFEWLGRWDNVINSGGVKVHPEQVVAKIATVVNGELAVLGIPDARLGQRVVLVVEGSERFIDLNDCSDKAGLDKFERPKNVFFVNLFPRTDSGKIQLSKLKAMVMGK